LLELATSEDLAVLSTRIAHLQARITTLNRRITDMADATQADIDNLTSQVQQVATDLDATRSKLQTEIDTLAGQGVDVTALQDAVAPLDAAVQSLGDLAPTPPQ
jgi:uncharacterized protein YlxW (UPF0749 family)